jgi:hypothetical protein
LRALFASGIQKSIGKMTACAKQISGRSKLCLMQDASLLLIEAGGYEITYVEIMMARANIIALGLPSWFLYGHGHDIVRWQRFFCLLLDSFLAPKP